MKDLRRKSTEIGFFMESYPLYRTSINQSNREIHMVPTTGIDILRFFFAWVIMICKWDAWKMAQLSGPTSKTFSLKMTSKIEPSHWTICNSFYLQVVIRNRRNQMQEGMRRRRINSSHFIIFASRLKYKHEREKCNSFFLELGMFVNVF